MSKYKSYSASMVYLLRKQNLKTQILLQKRSKSVIGSGLWEASAAGHVEENESLTMCAKREALEEIGVKFDVSDIDFVTITHVNAPNVPYYNGHFFVSNWQGEPTICESDKCELLKWFDIDTVPLTMFADRNKAIQNYKDKITYSEIGWK